MFQFLGKKRRKKLKIKDLNKYLSIPIRKWTNLFPFYVEVLAFGGIQRREKTVPHLVEAVHAAFLNTSGVG
jgi:hypothetical protein